MDEMAGSPPAFALGGANNAGARLHAHHSCARARISKTTTAVYSLLTASMPYDLTTYALGKVNITSPQPPEKFKDMFVFEGKPDVSLFLESLLPEIVRINFGMIMD